MSWPQASIPLGSVLNVRYGKASAASDRDARGSYPVVGSAGEMARTDKPLVLKPAIVIGRKGNVGQSHYFEAGCWPTDTTFYVEPGADIDPLFLLLQLEHLNLRSLDRSTATPSLRREDLEAQPIVLPLVPEQRRIVAILEEHLSDLDDANRSLGSAAARLARLAESAIREAVSVPEATEVALPDLVSTPLSNGRSVRERAGGFPVLRLTAMKTGKLDLSERKNGDWTAHQAAAFLVRRGDFMITRGNGSLALVGRGALVDVEPDEVAFPDTMIRARPDRDRVDEGWLTYVWNSRSVREQIERVARTSAGIYKINQAQLNGILVPLLPVQQQRAAVARLDVIRDQARRCEQAIGAAIARGESLRRVILASAFSGRLTGHGHDAGVIHELAEEESA